MAYNPEKNLTLLHCMSGKKIYHQRFGEKQILTETKLL